MISAEDRESLAAAVNLTLDLLDCAERRLTSTAAYEERVKHDAIKRERRRYKALRACLVADERHGVPVAKEFLDMALGASYTLPNDELDDEVEELFQAWLDEGRGISGW